MSLVGPWLNNIGSKKRKVKYASAEAKKRDLELQAEWQSLKQKIDKTAKIMPSRPLTRPVVKLGPPPGRETRFIPSRDSGLGVAAKKENPVYTGDKVLGVSIVHKSCLQPVFSETQAKDFASMRR
ncbi:MAG: hypothetical protein EBU90_07390 [Proteobacteria bacterium]|nr:hypothetical protein [Pseudomonadota bacterium]NBP13473.1 hypothetical protein [bacterium]